MATAATSSKQERNRSGAHTEDSPQEEEQTEAGDGDQNQDQDAKPTTMVLSKIFLHFFFVPRYLIFGIFIGKKNFFFLFAMSFFCFWV